MDRKRKKLTPEKIDVQKECQKAEITALKQNLVNMEAKLMRVIAELEQVKEEQACGKINFETQKCELESKIDKYEEQCTKLQNENEKLESENEKLETENGKLQSENEKLQSENKKLQMYLQHLEPANIIVEQRSQTNLCNTDLNSQTTKVKKENDDVLNFNSLPNEIIVEVFSYLTQNKLGQIARVCKKWNVLAKSQGLWNKVNVKFFPSCKYQTDTVTSFIYRLPSSVTSIRLRFTKYRNQIVTLDFRELCEVLQGECVHLEELILTDSELLRDCFSTVIVLCSHFLQNLKNLVFHRCIFSGFYERKDIYDTSKIALLDLSWCKFQYVCGPEFSRMPDLKVLCLYGSDVSDPWFPHDNSFFNQLHVLNVGETDITARLFYEKIQNNGLNLKELHLCSLLLFDNYLNFNSAFPHLQTLCLTNNWVTCEAVVSFIQSCPSLENVYVDRDVAKSFAAHPFVVANRCKAGIVKVHKSFRLFT